MSILAAIRSLTDGCLFAGSVTCLGRRCSIIRESIHNTFRLNILILETINALYICEYKLDVFSVLVVTERKKKQKTYNFMYY